MRKLHFVLVLLAAALCFAGELAIFWPDVEQGACTLIIGPTGDGVLIDAGTLGGHIPDEPLVPWLKSLSNVYPNFKLKYIIVTHYHEDHICWIDDVVASGLLDPKGVIYDRGGTYTTSTFSQYISAANKYRQTLSPGTCIDLGGGATLTAIIVGGRSFSGAEIRVTEENDLSIGLLLSYKNFQVWIGGDLGRSVERFLAPLLGDVDVYVIHHHGSYTSSDPEFLARLKPELAICQVGQNEYGHPNYLVVENVLSLRATRGSSPIVILQNRGEYRGILPNLYVADPDGAGPLPGTIKLITDGEKQYSVYYPYNINASQTKAPSLTFETDKLNCTIGYNLTLILDSVELVYNHSVGDDWSLSVTVNGHTFSVSPRSKNLALCTLQIGTSDVVKVTATAIERDKIPDVGTQSEEINPRNLQTTREFVINVKVVENAGRYKGNAALWRFKFKVNISAGVICQ